jgi:hypothetical protein
VPEGLFAMYIILFKKSNQLEIAKCLMNLGGSNLALEYHNSAFESFSKFYDMYKIIFEDSALSSKIIL